MIETEKAAPISLTTNHLYRNPSSSHRDLWFTGYLSFFERCSIFEWRFDASEFTKFHVLNVVPPIISKKRQSINPLISPNWPWLGLTLFSRIDISCIGTTRDAGRFHFWWQKNRVLDWRRCLVEVSEEDVATGRMKTRN